MKKVRITVMKRAHYADLIEKYENPMPHACDMHYVGTGLTIELEKV